MKTVYLFKQYIDKTTGLKTKVKTYNLKNHKITIATGQIYDNEDFHNKFELIGSVPYYFSW